MKKFLLTAPLALASIAVLASPAAAAPYNSGQIRNEIAQLDRQINNIRGLSPREEQRLENQVDQLQRLYKDYARGGFSRGELQRLDGQLSSVKAQIFAQSRDRNGRFDRNDGPGRDGHFDHDRNDRGPGRR